MTWLSPDAWVEACGAAGTALLGPYVPRGGEDALLDALGSDPRRLAFLLGESGVDTSRMALEVARCASEAFYPAPLPLQDPARSCSELAERLRAVPATDRPTVVLDGPNREELVALGRMLLCEPIHPRLLVLVPATVDEARGLLHAAERYPFASAIVATLEEKRSATPDLTDAPEALLPFALAGRRKTDRLDGEAARLCKKGLLAEDPASGTTLCLLPDRARRSLIDSAILRHSDGAGRLGRMFAADPTLRTRASLTLLKWGTEATLAPLFDLLVAGSAADFLALLEGIDIRPPFAPWLAKRLSAHAEALLGAQPDVETAARLEDQLARLAISEWDPDGAAHWADAAMARQVPALNARLAERLAESTLDPDAHRRAAAAFREAEDQAGLARVLHRLVRVLLLSEKFDEARVYCAELLELENARGSFVGALAARTLATEIAVQRGDLPGALAYAEHVLADRRRLGDTQGQILILHRLSMLRGAAAGAEQALHEALRLEQTVANPIGEAACHLALGDTAVRRGASKTGALHYASALEIYEAHGMPALDGLRSALDRARGTVPADPPPVAPSRLVQISLRRPAH